MYQGGARGHRLYGVEDSGELLILHLYQPQSLLGNLKAGGCHRGYPISHITHLFLKSMAVLQPSLLGKVNTGDAQKQPISNIPAGDYRLYPRQAFRLFGVNPFD
ncbi:hypothetical protein ES703_67386 [subsurface metagenome]